jgi:hypothetical protein
MLCRSIVPSFSGPSDPRRISFCKVLLAPLDPEAEGIMSPLNTGIFVCMDFLHILTMVLVWIFPDYDWRYLYGFAPLLGFFPEHDSTRIM